MKITKKYIFIGLLLLVIVGVLGFWYYRDKIFSKEILRLEILGPENAKMGDEIEYTLKYKNNGNFVLEKPKIIFELPTNSLTEDNKTRISQDIKDIYPGEENFIKFKARLLGKEGDLMAAHASLTYVPHNLSARYESTSTFTTKIETVPITLTFDLPSKIEKGKELTYSINYFSNIDYPLENMSVRVDSINGFNFKSADPVSLDNFEWKLATLNKAHGGRITIKGTIFSDTGNHITFTAHLGMWVNGTFVIVKDVTQDVEIIQPLLYISQQINNASNYVASPGETLHYKIFIRNIGSTPFNDAFVLSKLSSQAFDLATLHSLQGQVKANDSLVTFDPKQVTQLASLSPNQETSVEFDITLKDNWMPQDADKNTTVIKNVVSISDISQEFTTKVSSKLDISQKIYFSSQSGINNSGPLPPEVNKSTTYTVVWQVKNYLNDVKNVKVRAVLPQGVTLTATIKPDNQISNFSLDNSSREVVWSVGDIKAGAGVANTSPSISFQISLTPSVLQKGTTPNLIGQATISGEDQFTGAPIQSISPSVNANLPDDAGNSGKGVVQ